MSSNYLIRLITIFILAFATTHSFAQSPKKGAVSSCRLLASLSPDEIRSQRHSALAEEMPVEAFMVYYIKNGRERLTKKHNEESIDLVYKDSAFTYFLHRASFYAIRFLKVNNVDMDAINTAAIDGNAIRDAFYNEVIPQEDKERVENARRKCGGTAENYSLRYRYDKSTRLVEIRCKWKLSCVFIGGVNKTYQAYYSIDSRAFTR